MTLNGIPDITLKEQVYLATLDGWSEIRIHDNDGNPFATGRWGKVLGRIKVHDYDDMNAVMKILVSRGYLDINLMQIEDGYQLDIVDKHSKKHGYWSKDIRIAIYKSILVAEGLLPKNDEGEH